MAAQVTAQEIATSKNIKVIVSRIFSSAGVCSALFRLVTVASITGP
jgi:hypothetical protein